MHYILGALCKIHTFAKKWTPLSISTHLEVALQTTLTFRLGPGLLSSWPSSMAPLVVSSSSLWKYRSSRDQPSTTTTAKLRRGSSLQLWPPSSGGGVGPTQLRDNLISAPAQHLAALFVWNHSSLLHIDTAHSQGKPRQASGKHKETEDQQNLNPRMLTLQVSP